MTEYNKITCEYCGGDHFQRDCPDLREERSLAAMSCSTWFIGQTLPCKFDVSKAMLVLDVITTHEALQKSYAKSFWTKRKVWEEKHQRALDNHNEALRLLEVEATLAVSCMELLSGE